ncbi:porin [Porticoccaceae bacterium LTM1]|nr:porin [Porticoccaceae bacterium LTM1]
MFKKTLVALAVASASFAAVADNEQTQPSLEEMWKLIQQQNAEIKELKAELNKNKTQIQETEIKVVATAEAVEKQATVSSASARWAEKTTLGGYGEHHFNHFEEGTDKVDAHRFVLFMGHQFNDKVSFFSELEVEHGFAGPDDEAPGEVELEQAYIKWDFAEKHSAVMGQFLVPVGILNETHEPDTFYGTERNNVESKIVPATWWETGVMLQGELAPGFTYNAAIHSGLNLDDADGVRDGRQKSAKADAEDLAFTGRLKYTGIAGLELAATLQYQQDVTQGTFETADATLFETHAVYQSGNFGLRALYADWNIDGIDFNLSGYDEQTGWYIEPSYKVTDKTGLFVRYSEWNNLEGLSGSQESERLDYGVNYWLTDTVVLKADYSDDRNGGNDSLNLGLGWSFY